MGGLKKYLPVTYWTFLIGALAIAGVPLLSGFFSKDEILYRTYTSGNTSARLLWTIGAITSLLTATYMFRLVFLAFHGERRQDAPAAPAHPEEEEPAAHHGDAHGAHDAHPSTSPGAGGHGHGIHDAPPSMAIPLIVLAVGSIVAGYVGVPHALGGSNRIESFLEPSFEVAESARRTQTLGAEAAPAAPEGVRAASLERQEPSHEAGGEHGTSEELMLMAVSSGIAIAGILIAAYFWVRNRPAADAMSRRLHGVYNLLLHKYYVDEIYDAAIVQPIKIVSTVGLWRSVDAGLIDGAVNGVGQTVRGGGSGLRRAQTGSVRTYAAALFLGVVLILGWYLFRS